MHTVPRRAWRRIERAAERLPVADPRSAPLGRIAGHILRLQQAVHGAHLEGIASGRFTLLGRTVCFRGLHAVAWRRDLGEGNNALWRMTLSYFGFAPPLMASGEEQALQTVAALVRSLERQNSFAAAGVFRDVWNPYSASHRLINLLVGLHWFERNAPPDSDSAERDGARATLLRHIALCAAFVAHNLERDLRYNHLLKDYVALLVYACGVGRLPPAWRFLDTRLADCVESQVLADGGHAERSPMYHALSIVDLMVLADAGVLDRAASSRIERCLARMRRALAAMAHPDGDIALFNDSWLGEALPAQLLANGSAAERQVLADTGYVQLRSGADAVIFDCGACGPDDNPAHAHADFLALELSVAGRRFLVDFGVPTYSSGRLRDAARSAASHNGPRFADFEPLEYWLSFRVGRRGRAYRIADLECAMPSPLWCAGWQDGYAPIGGATARALALFPQRRAVGGRHLAGRPGLRSSRRFSHRREVACQECATFRVCRRRGRGHRRRHRRFCRGAGRGAVLAAVRPSEARIPLARFSEPRRCWPLGRVVVRLGRGGGACGSGRARAPGAARSSPRLRMKIVVCGLGYVGATTAACLLKDGHHVVGIDVDAAKNESFAAGRSPVRERGIDELLAAGLAEGRLASARAIADHADADALLVCVGTPAAADGRLDLAQVRAVTEEIASAIAKRPANAAPLAVVYRSTMLPGSLEKVAMPVLEREAGPPGERFEVVYNPEFLREGSAIEDYFAPPKVVVGERLPGTGAAVVALYRHLDAPVFRVPIAVAEMAKYADNAFHAVKVAFANELGRLAGALSLPPQMLADLLLADTKLNISPAYLRPGGAFGGACLPKDLRALGACMRENEVCAPLLTGALASNDAHKQYLADRVARHTVAGGRVLLLGLTFKAATDDLRESPLVDLAERLLGGGFALSVFDPDLDLDRLTGANRVLAQTHLKGLVDCVVDDLPAALATADAIVLGKSMPAVAARLGADPRLLDLSRL